MFGRIFIPLEDEDVLVVPAEAVRRVGQLDEVDVVEDGARRVAGPFSSAGRSTKAARCSRA